MHAGNRNPTQDVLSRKGHILGSFLVQSLGSLGSGAHMTSWSRALHVLALLSSGLALFPIRLSLHEGSFKSNSC